ncbi:hypothetical protein Taro_013010 [Colocasia esculenta]|uniref:Uncharacterized protein n=1 Tax=Colocasia esculenta TaxID=4460 RepID=A0A843U5G6_COLES|nr:hypothetical protein [Colocasia esculenta]
MDLSHDRAAYSSTFFSRPSQHGKVHQFVINGRGIKKMKKKTLRATFPSSSLSFCQEIIKYSCTQKKGYCKSRNRKSSQSHIKQCDVSRTGFPQRVLRSSKRARPLASSPGHHVSRTILTLLIDNNVVLPREKVYYMRQRDGHVMKEGRITRDGIKCKCCKGVFTISDFEAHAGSSKHRPAANIFLQDGRNLLQCKAQIRDKSKPKEFPHKRKKRDCSSYQSDSICSVCQDGGSLVLCDHCPSSFHLFCVGLEEVPEGKWFCPSCRCGICGLSEFNCDSEFSEKTVIFCDQCEREYHVGCLRRKGLAGLESCPNGNWFCSESCSKIFMGLHGLLGKSNPTTADGFSWTILRSRKESDPDPGAYDMETIIDHHCKLSVATEVMHECFEPITEPRNNGDLVTDIIFNKESELNRLNFWGFYTMLLQRGDELISVATFRVFGEKVAEMPLVGTRVQYRRKGMCRLLMDELEKLLSSLGVERLLLPAIPQLLETWTASFGFCKMTHSERLMLSEFTLLSFQDTTMCQKLLRSSHATLKEAKGSHDKLLGMRNVEIDFNSVISEVVETVEPIKSLPSSADDEPYPMSTECPSIGKCSDGCPTVQMPPPSIMPADPRLCPLGPGSHHLPYWSSSKAGRLVTPWILEVTDCQEHPMTGVCSACSGRRGLSPLPILRDIPAGTGSFHKLAPCPCHHPLPGERRSGEDSQEGAIVVVRGELGKQVEAELYRCCAESDGVREMLKEVKAITMEQAKVVVSQPGGVAV